MGICDNLTVLDYGKVIASGKPADVRTHPEVTEPISDKGLHDERLTSCKRSQGLLWRH